MVRTRPVLGGLALASLVCFTGCSSAGSEDGAENEDALSSKTIPIDRALSSGLEKDFEQSFSHTFAKDGVSIDAKLTAKVHLELTDAKLTGQVTVSHPLIGAPSVLAANLTTSARYGATVEADVDIEGNGTTDLLQRYAGDFQKTPMGGESLTIAQNLMPLDIPLDGGPLFVHTHLDIAVACQLTEIEGSAQVQASAGVGGGVGVTLQYDKSAFGSHALPLPGLPDPRFRFSADPPDLQPTTVAPHVTNVSGHAKLRCGVQPTVVVLLERAIGAKIIVEPYVNIAAAMEGSPPALKLSETRGVQGFVQTDVEVLGHSLAKPIQFALFDKPL